MNAKSAGLSGKVILITGTTSGLGRHFALTLAAAGARVAVTGRREDRLQNLCAEISSKGGAALPLALDVQDVQSIRQCVERCETEWGPIDILVNNAGVNGAARAIDVTPEIYDELFGTNLRGAYFMSTEVAKRMMARYRSNPEVTGKIINIASAAANVLLPGLTLYNMSKAGMAMMTRALAREWARQGVSVNAINPGYIETELNAEWFHSEKGKAQIATFLRRRLNQANDLDGALLLLCSEGSAIMTGSIIDVDDGQSLLALG
ncbi:MAG: SDR family oxidoreductase [Alphaproteobacteria bacterium]|nr:SDR family oxidoreductase [Alphaproteobacteria bacterium]